QSANRPLALADLKWVIGETFRAQGKHTQALESLLSAKQDFEGLGMSTYVAYLCLAIADTFLTLHRDREAEVEILAALPTIEEQKMVPEGLAAIALLRESVRRRKTDPQALRQLRERLQPKS